VWGGWCDVGWRMEVWLERPWRWSSFARREAEANAGKYFVLLSILRSENEGEMAGGSIED